MSFPLFYKLMLAHLIADFCLQTDDTCQDKQRFHFRSVHLCIHTIVVFILSCIASSGNRMMAIAIMIAFTHFLIDGFKSFIPKLSGYKGLVVFLLDQTLHITVLILICTSSAFTATETIMSCANLADFTQVIIILCATIMCGKPANIIIKFLLNGLNINSIKGKTNSDDKVGAKIGSLERLLSVILIIIGQYEAVGLVITAKSILRFKDEDGPRTEYVLIGTLISYMIAIGVGLIARIAMGYRIIQP